jgi:hypothetical protein
MIQEIKEILTTRSRPSRQTGKSAGFAKGERLPSAKDLDK